MGEADLEGVEAEALERVGRGAVLLVAGNGVARFAAMHAELVLAAGLGPEAEKGTIFVGFDDFIMGQSSFAMLRVVGTFDVEKVIFFEVGLPSAITFGHLPFRDGKVDLVDELLFELRFEVVAGFFMVGEDHDAGGLPIKAVDRIDAPVIESLLEEGMDGGAIFKVGCDAEEAGGLFEDDDVIIFMEQAELAADEGDFVADGNFLTWRNGGVGADLGTPVDGYTASLQPRAEGVLGAVGRHGLQDLEKGRALISCMFHNFKKF